MPTTSLRLTSIFASLFLGGSLALVAAPVGAATTIVVTTTTDEIADNSVCSLREAIIAANTDPGMDECNASAGANAITLPAGIYDLTIAGPAEDDAATGDLDIRDGVTITG